MVNNRSMPASGVIPVLTYPDVVAASTWLCAAFGFRERLVIGTHRVQLDAGLGAGSRGLRVDVLADCLGYGSGELGRGGEGRLIRSRHPADCGLNLELSPLWSIC